MNLLNAGCCLVDASSADSEVVHRWNGALKAHPAMVALCCTAIQISTALRAARQFGVPDSVHNGGHDWIGRSVRNGNLVIDISGMTGIEIDVERREAIIGGGVTASQLNQAAGKKGLSAVIGNDVAVSMAGLTLGGGYGPLMTRFGLACDSLLSAEIVLPDGRTVTCDATNDADLFWALRGGGGNFAIITSMRLRLHAPGTLLVGNIVFPWNDARTVLAQYAELMLRAPADLFGAAVLASGPLGKPVVVISLVWMGEITEGEGVISEMAAAGNPIVTKAEPMAANSLLALTDGKLPAGLGYEVATRWFSTLAPETIGTLLELFEARTSPLTSIIVHHCHGVATDVPGDTTAFGMREPHFTTLIYAGWRPLENDGEPHKAWARSLDAALVSTSLREGMQTCCPMMR